MTLAQSLSREWRLILAAAKLRPGDADVKLLRTELENPAFDWNRLIRIACQHDVAPLVYQAIQRFVPNVSERHTGVGRLKTLYCGNAMRNALLYKELECILSALRDAGAPVVVLKGAALAENVYRNRALRPMSDVDLLIQRNDLEAVEQ